MRNEHIKAPDDRRVGNSEAAASAEAQQELLKKEQRDMTILANDLDKVHHGAKLVDLAEHDDLNTAEWRADPRKAVDFLTKYGGSNKEFSEKLIHLNEMLQRQKLDTATGKIDTRYAIAEQTVFAIADNLERRRAEVKKVHGDLQDVRETSENALNQKVSNFVENAYDTYGRMSTPEKLGTVAALFLFLRMALKSKNAEGEENTLFKPLLVGFAGLLGANAITQAATGKSLTDWAGEKLGLERFMPMAKDALPVAMESLAASTRTTMPSELHAMAKLAYVRMSDIKAIYNSSKENIDPTIFGLKEKKSDGLGEPGEISGKQLFKIVDAVMKKPNVVMVGKNGKREHFRTGREFVEAHPEYDFATVVYWLYEKEAIAGVVTAMSDVDRIKYVKGVRDDMETTFQNFAGAADAKVKVHPRWGNVSFYGVTFLTERKKDKDEGNHQYVFHLGDDERVSLRLKDGEMAKGATLDLLRDAAARYLEEKHIALLRWKYAANFTDAKLIYGGQTAVAGITNYADKNWHLIGVRLNSRRPVAAELPMGGGASVDLLLQESDLGQDTSNVILSRTGAKSVRSSTALLDFNNEILNP